MSDSDDQLAARLSDADPTVRRLAVLELGDLEDEVYLPALARALREDSSSEVRAEAARVLSGWDDEAAVQGLAAALLDDDERVRDVAAQSLSELKDARLGVHLLPYARSERASVRAAALRALRELRVPEAAEVAREALTNADVAVRREAISVLGWLRHEEALPAIAGLAASDVDIEVRRVATGALGFGDQRVVPHVLRALRDDAWTVREEAATTLGKLRAREALTPLCGAMADPYWQVRIRAARALGRIADRAARDVLVEALGHTMSNLRKEAALALGELGDETALEPLQRAAEDADPEVRKAARIALQQIATAAVEAQ